MATDELQSGQIVGFTGWLLPIMEVEERDRNSTSMTIISSEEARTLEAEAMQMPLWENRELLEIEARFKKVKDSHLGKAKDAVPYLGSMVGLSDHRG